MADQAYKRQQVAHNQQRQGSAKQIRAPSFSNNMPPAQQPYEQNKWASKSNAQPGTSPAIIGRNLVAGSSRQGSENGPGPKVVA